MATSFKDPEASADEVLALVVAGNERFLRGETRIGGVLREMLADLAKGQRSFATIVGSSDSRVPPECTFDAKVEVGAWKLDGIERSENCQKVFTAARRAGRDKAGSIVLGRGEDEEKVRQWLTNAAGEGKKPFEATVDACKLGPRPLVLTSFACILAVVPLVLAKGTGAEMRVALGLAMFSGMLAVTIFGIFFTPVLYVVLRWFSGRTVAALAPDARKVLAVGPGTGGGPLPSKHGVRTGSQVETPTETEWGNRGGGGMLRPLGLLPNVLLKTIGNVLTPHGA